MNATSDTVNVDMPKWEVPTSLAQGLGHLPLVGQTWDVAPADSIEYWRDVFSQIWGPLRIEEIGGRLSGRLHSRRIGELTFNRIAFGNQIFECINDKSSSRDEPFFSLTFPQAGTAECFVGRSRMQLVPNHAYLINVETAARLCVQSQYSTINIQIPVSKLEHRLGRRVKIMPRSILRVDAAYHLMHELISHLTRTPDSLDERTVSFLSRQLLDTVAFFLTDGTGTSEDTLATSAVRTRVMAWMDENYRDQSLNPATIA